MKIVDQATMRQQKWPCRTAMGIKWVWMCDWKQLKVSQSHSRSVRRCYSDGWCRKEADCSYLVWFLRFYFKKLLLCECVECCCFFPVLPSYKFLNLDKSAGGSATATAWFRKRLRLCACESMCVSTSCMRCHNGCMEKWLRVCVSVCGQIVNKQTWFMIGSKCRNALSHCSHLFLYSNKFIPAPIVRTTIPSHVSTH